MKSQVTSNVLANFFEDLENGSSDLTTYEDGHPEMADDLGSLAEVAQSIAPPPEVSLEPLSRARLRAGLLYQMAQTSRTDRNRVTPRERRSIVGGQTLL